MKDCAASARTGVEYQPKHPHPSPPPPQPDSPPPKAVETGGAGAGAGGVTAADVVSHDVDDLTLTQKKDKAAAPTDDPASSDSDAGDAEAKAARERMIVEASGSIVSTPSGFFAGWSMWQALGLWMAILGACLLLLPRLFRLRRRQRSGMRTE